ncbi:MAG: hypothetical protein JRN07_03865 [Nitrososphaerota archaeon]|nr:hypothetical protein [Nitrososphaerota archaeon]
MLIGGCRFADDVLYDTERGTWARLEGDASATVGVDTVLAWVGGPITSVSFKKVGDVVGRGKALGAIEGPRHFDTVRSPLSGRVVAVNAKLAAEPGLVNREPFGSGWFARVEPLAREELAALKAPAAAEPELRARVSQMKVRCFAEFPDTEMYEIGTECSAVLVRLDDLLSGSRMGAVVHLVSDDPASEVEMVRWSERTGNPVLETRREGALVHYIVKKARS